MAATQQKQAEGKSTSRSEGQMPAFLSTLYDEHRYFQSLLDIVREQQEMLEDGYRPHLSLLREALEYLADYPDDYHHPREDLLFDRMRNASSETQRALDSLIAGHDEINRESNRLYFAVTRACNGEDVRPNKLSEGLKHFVDQYEKHMREEEEHVFSVAMSILGEEDWEQLDEQVEYIEDPLFGTRVRRRYRRLANALEARLGVAKRDLIIAEYLGIEAMLDGFITLSEAGVSLGSIVWSRSGNAMRENLKATRDAVGSGEITKALKLPMKLLGNIETQVRGGFDDSWVLLRNTIEDVRTPYDMRLDALKKLLKKDWGN